MSEFTIHNINTAKTESIPALKKAEQLFGFVLNLIAVLAELPSSVERQVIMLTISRYAENQWNG